MSQGLNYITKPFVCDFVLLSTLFRAIEKAQASSQNTLEPGSFVLNAPITDPQKLICIGMNYIDHCTEQNIPVPKEPVIFSKFSSAITDPDGAVILTEETEV